VSIDGAPLHTVLFRLAARAPNLTLEQLMARLTTSLANHYAAVACSIHTDQSGWAAAGAEPIRAFRNMARLDRARQETIEADLVKKAVSTKEMTSALDLKERDEIETFLNRVLGAIDIFAFPLVYEGKVRAVLVIYLSLDSDPLEDADLYGLMAVGELLVLAGTELEAPQKG
jgi:hypothetical protein